MSFSDWLYNQSEGKTLLQNDYLDKKEVPVYSFPCVIYFPNDIYWKIQINSYAFVV